MTVNLETAEALGITMPPSILARADRVIEYKTGSFPATATGRSNPLVNVGYLGIWTG